VNTPSSPARPSTAALGVLGASGLATAGLAVYQWLELLVVRNGGKVACAINETVNCAAVWNSKFASFVHDWLGMPVAALGVVWGVAAVALTVLLWKKLSTDEWPLFAASVKFWAVAGLLSIVAFGGASIEARAVCLTCLGTYGLVVVFAFAAFMLLPGPRWPQSQYLVGGMAWVFVVFAPTFLVTLIPAGNTPKAGAVTRFDGTTEDQLIQSLLNLPKREAMVTAAARQKFLASPDKDVSDLKVRVRAGAEAAPIKVVEFSDVLCPHCAVFEESLEELRGAAPEGSLSIEPRLFPLVDDGCVMPGEKDSPKDVRCTGAKAQICSEDHPLYWDVRKALFANQQSLRSADKVLEIVAKVTSRSKDSLLACINSMDTQARLASDVTYAKRYDIEGTPLVLLNGRATLPSAGFILGMAVSRGDVNAEWFKRLPEPPPMDEGREGHGH
jgi:serine/threonine-protein kinase